VALVNDDRLAELGRNLGALRERIAAIRDPDGVTIVAVSKTWPPSDVLLLNRLGASDFGENYDAEAAQKAAALEAMGVTPRWHFVGHLQRNKARSVATYADVVHGLDRTESVVALANGAARAGREVTGLVQVRYDEDPRRYGVAPEDALALADEIAATATVRFGGLMCIAPRELPSRPVFAKLRALGEAVRRDHPDATTLSMGMTRDLEDALREGANCVRVGTALFGERHPPVG
jgi:pyridoxal phosphate enzyme (YggS family)